MLSQKIISTGSFFDPKVIFSLFLISNDINFIKIHIKLKAIKENHSSVILFRKSAIALATPTNKTAH